MSVAVQCRHDNLIRAKSPALALIARNCAQHFYQHLLDGALPALYHSGSALYSSSCRVLQKLLYFCMEMTLGKHITWWPSLTANGVISGTSWPNHLCRGSHHSVVHWHDLHSSRLVSCHQSMSQQHAAASKTRLISRQAHTFLMLDGLSARVHSSCVHNGKIPLDYLASWAVKPQMEPQAGLAPAGNHCNNQHRQGQLFV